MARRGRFIVFEGGEATGKSTQASLLAGQLDAVLTREPGGTQVGEQIRSLVLDPALPPVELRSEVLLMLAARAQHVAEVVEPSLAAGRHVVCDRFSGSTLAYQGYGRGLPLEELERLSLWASGGLEPDLVLLLEVPAEVAAARLANRGPADRIEQEGAAFLSRVRNGFRELADLGGDRWRVVDAGGTVSEVARLVRDQVDLLLAPEGGIPGGTGIGGSQT